MKSTVKYADIDKEYSVRSAIKSSRSFARSCAMVFAIAAYGFSMQGSWASEIAIGPRPVQQILQTQLFTNQGRWFLLDDGPCYAFLESPVIHFKDGRLVLDAHLSSRLGQRIGGYCAGAGFASAVTLSARLVGQGATLTLADIRVDHVDDSVTRDLLSLLQKVAPQALPQAFSIDLLHNVRGSPLQLGGYTVSVTQFVIQQIQSTPAAITVRFDLSLAAP
jgi:hypothetical protein